MTATVRAGTKSSAAIAVMVKHATWSMEKVVPKIADATGLDMDKAKHYYVLFVRKGLAPGEVPAKAAKPKAEKAAVKKTVKPCFDRAGEVRRSSATTCGKLNQSGISRPSRRSRNSLTSCSLVR